MKELWLKKGKGIKEQLRGLQKGVRMRQVYKWIKRKLYRNE